MKLKELLWLLPALALYVVVIVAFATDEKVGDEGRYLHHAENLTHGFYTTREAPELICGPGYPLILTPLVAIGAPLLAIKLLNGVFLLIGVVLMYATARQYAGRAASLVFAWLFAIYTPFLRFLPFVLTEALSVMLVACVVYFLTRWYRTRKFGWLIGGVVSFTYLALTKIFFGWVLMAGAVLFLVLSLAKPLRPLWRTGVVLALALVLCTPYLAYTYQLTGTPFLWAEGGFGGRTPFYFMTSPYAGEYGDWHGTAEVFSNPQMNHHRAFFEELSQLSLSERQARIRREVLQNIRRSPAKCLFNWGCNVSRMLFSYPYSYTPQKPSTLFYLVPNMLLVSLMLFLVYPTFVGRRRLPPEVFSLLLLTALVLGGSSLPSAEVRHFAVAVPMLGVWIVVALTRVVQIRFIRDGQNGRIGPDLPAREPGM